MSLVFRRSSKRDFVGATAAQLIPDRMAVRSGSVQVGPDSALQASAVWACLRLRADLISTMPVDVYRRVNGVQVEVPKPTILVTPGGEKVHVTEWLYSTQFDLDRCGNAVGIITERDGAGRPGRIDLVAFSEVSAKVKGSEIVEWRVGKKSYTPDQVWHEKQFTVPGLAVGLSPVAYAAMSVGSYLSAQQFALDWFGSGVAPAGHLKRTDSTNMDAEVADVIKRRFKAAVSNRDVFVSGGEWEYLPGEADASAAAFLEEKKYGVTDITRFFGVPADMIDAEGSSSSITYANVTQRNVQLLVMNLGPAIARREAALSTLLAAPRFVKFNTDAILRMDPSAVTANLVAQTGAGLRTIDEGRAILNLPPLTAAQIAAQAPPLVEPAPAAMLSARAAEPVPQMHYHAGPVTVAPEIRLHQEPTTVNVPAPVVSVRDAAAPVVNVYNDVQPTPVEVTNTVEPAAVFVEAPPAVVQVETPVTVTVPEEGVRKSTTTFDRDGNGLVKKSTTIEGPA